MRSGPLGGGGLGTNGGKGEEYSIRNFRSPNEKLALFASGTFMYSLKDVRF
jgi:hypothetical protein